MKLFNLIFILALLGACSSQVPDFVPKPKGYNRITLPKASYRILEGGHPFEFEYSTAAQVETDKSPGAEPHWIIINYPSLNAKIQFTYKPLQGNLDKLDKHVADAYKLAAKHQVKATSQIEKIVQLKSGKKAVVIELEGEVPSHYQFYMTDTSQHYLRGAMYLSRATLNDSLAPVVAYLKADCAHILETLKWKK